jgi:formate transporter
MIDVKERASEETQHIELDREQFRNEAGYLQQVLKERQGLIQAAVMVKAVDALETMKSSLAGIGTADYTPPECAKRCETVGVTKGNLNTLSTIILGIMAGLFIGLGAMLATVVTTNTGLGFGLTKLLGGLVFCLGLILVVVAGAELFTGNNLIVMSWLSGKTRLTSLLRNWGLVYVANLAGSLLLVVIMFSTMQWSLSSHGVGVTALNVANAKVNLSFASAFSRGILCNMLVCLAVWLCFSARTVPGKILAILFPITAFVAAGFEHSIANMYFIPMGILMSHQSSVLTAAGLTSANVAHLNVMGMIGNLIPVTLGNIVGGVIMVGGVYWLSYLRQERAAATCAMPVTKAAPAATPVANPVKAGTDPIMVGVGSKALFEVLGRARDDNSFLASLSEDPHKALKDYDLTPQEKAALASGDIRQIESQIGALDNALQTWLMARLSQEKW